MDVEDVPNDIHWTLYSSNGLWRRPKWQTLDSIQFKWTLKTSQMTYIGLYTVQMDFKYVLNDRHLTLYSSNGLNRRHKRTYIGLYTVQMVFTDAKKWHTLDSIQFKWTLEMSKMTYIGLYTVQNGLWRRQKRTYIGLYTVWNGLWILPKWQTLDSIQLEMDFEDVPIDRHWTLFS